MTMHIAQFAGTGKGVASNPLTDSDGQIQAAKGLLISQSITLTGSNQVSSAFITDARLIRVAVEVAAWIAIGATPVATTVALRIYMPAGSFDYFAVSPGDKIAGITA